MLLRWVQQQFKMVDKIGESWSSLRHFMPTVGHYSIATTHTQTFHATGHFTSKSGPSGCPLDILPLLAPKRESLKMIGTGQMIILPSNQMIKALKVAQSIKYWPHHFIIHQLTPERVTTGGMWKSLHAGSEMHSIAIQHAKNYLN